MTGRFLFYILPFIPVVLALLGLKYLLIYIALVILVEIYFAYESISVFLRENIYLGLGSVGWLIWNGIWIAIAYLVYLTTRWGLVISLIFSSKVFLLLSFMTEQAILIYFLVALSLIADVFGAFKLLILRGDMVGLVLGISLIALSLIFHFSLSGATAGFWEKEEEKEKNPAEKEEGGKEPDSMPLSVFFSRNRMMMALGLRNNFAGILIGAVVRQTAYFFSALETLILDYKQRGRLQREARELFADFVRQNGIRLEDYISGDPEDIWGAVWNLPNIGRLEEARGLEENTKEIEMIERDAELLRKKHQNILSYFQAGEKIKVMTYQNGKPTEIEVEIPPYPRWGLWLFLEAIIDEAFLRFLQEQIIPQVQQPLWVQFDNLFLTYFPEFPIFKYFVQVYYANIDRSATNIAVVGRIGTGKSSSVYIPNLLNWMGNAIVYDPKGELFKRTAGYRREVLGQDIYVINAQAEYDKETGKWFLHSHRFNIIDLSSASAPPEGFDFTDTDIRDFIEALKKKVLPQGNAGEEKGWMDRAGEIAKAYLVFVNMLPRSYRRLETFLHLLYGSIPYDLLPPEISNELRMYYGEVGEEVNVPSQATLSAIIRWLEERVKSFIQTGMETESLSAIRSAIASATQFTRMAEETYTSIEASLNNMASALSESVVLTLSEATDFRYATMIRKPFTLYLITSLAPTDAQEFYFSMVMDLLIKEISRTAPESSVSKTTEIEPLAFFIDEFANIPAISGMGKLINTLRSRRVFFILGLQGIEQVRVKYGEEAKAIFTGISNYIFYPVALNPDDARSLSEMLKSQDLVRKITRLELGQGYLAVEKAIKKITQLRWFLIPALRERGGYSVEIREYPRLEVKRLKVKSLRVQAIKEGEEDIQIAGLLQGALRDTLVFAFEMRQKGVLADEDYRKVDRFINSLFEALKDPAFVRILPTAGVIKKQAERYRRSGKGYADALFFVNTVATTLGANRDVADILQTLRDRALEVD